MKECYNESILGERVGHDDVIGIIIEGTRSLITPRFLHCTTAYQVCI